MSLNIERYDLVRHGRVLATRPTGREVGREAADLLADSDGLLLSFWEVDVASPPFLAEVISALRAVLMAHENRWLLLTGLNEDVKESIEFVLRSQKMSVAALQDNQIELLGGSAQLAETLREAQRMGTFTAPDLAERLKMKLPALHQRLNVLLEVGALAREDDPSATRGKRGKYHTPSPADVDEVSGPLAPGDISAITV
jgi:hypothetical protein